ncbi:MAG: hypothetical protein MR278_07565 [Bacteroidales bacterium]|nr:hypothetical protein [Anaerotignum sp.]MCI5679817.1 hypothetical protein [Bacteroidales bacterium]MDY3925825.1 hypothetical protein [Anaerotignum sp.]
MKVLLILLGILKGIGIVLLALLLLLLLLVLVVLFSPIRYQLAGEQKAELGGSFGVSWLFGAVKIDGGYTQAESLKLKVKVLWFTLVGGEPKEKKEKKPKKKKAPKKEELKPDLQAAEKTTKQAEKPAEEKKEEPPKTEKKEEKSAEQPKQQRMERKQPKTVRRVKLSEVEEKPPTEDMDIQLEFNEDDAFFTGEEGKEEKKEKIPPIVKELWSIEEKKEIFKALGKLLKRLLKGILPGNLFIKGTIGTGDPTTTGYVLALAGVLTAKFGNDIQIKGDFTKATAEDMEVRVKGKIVLGKLLWAVLAFGLTKPVRKAIWKTIKFLRKKD